ncbi:MAG: hypothetical protein M1830_008601, partial [Pleopsidium flavum]
RKLQQALDDTIENVTKKRKLAVPNSVKAALHAAKAHTSKELVKAKVYSSTSRSNNKLVNKVSSRSLASSRESLQRSTTMSRLSAAVKKHTPVTYGRRRSSLSLSSARAKESDERPLSRRDSVKAVAASVRRNVVRTVRGSRRAAANVGGRSIRVIGGEDE